MSYPKFGTAGAGDLFYSRGLKNSYDAPAFLKELGLTAYEYQCGHGVNMGKEKANFLGEKARENNIALSIHAPYYINLATQDEERREKNLKYFMQSANLAREMGATRVIFHPGAVSKMTREEAFALSVETLDFIWRELGKNQLQDIIFCPETMGKMVQLGDLAEVIGFCKRYDNMLPCVDFGHMNCRTLGGIKTIEDYEAIFKAIADGLGDDKAKIIHCHFSKIEYGKSGEKKHLTFEDTTFGPDYEPLLELLYKKQYTPTIICESAGTQAEDALTMSRTYFSYVNEN